MKEIDLSRYFTPCPYMEAGTFYIDNTDRLGKRVEKYTVEEHFPSVEGADVVIIGLEESRGGSLQNASTPLCCNGAEKIRRELYNLYAGSSFGKIVDLGDFKCGKTLEDTFFALSEVIACMAAQHTVTILLGGTQDLTYAVYRAYTRLHRMINILSIDSRLNLADGIDQEFDPVNTPVTHQAYMARIVVEPDNYLFNYSNLGYQSYLVDNDAVRLMGRCFFDACRFGRLRENIQESEPYIREADCISFDLSAVRKSDSPANPWARPTGFTAEQICQMARYAGISKDVSVFGFFEYYPALDTAGLSAQLIAEMIWCFMDGMVHRIDDHPLAGSGLEFKTFVVQNDETDQDLTFHKCKQTDRWWLELPCTEEQKERYGRHCHMACSYQDYQTALEKELPPRLEAAVRRLK